MVGNLLLHYFPRALPIPKASHMLSPHDAQLSAAVDFAGKGARMGSAHARTLLPGTARSWSSRLSGMCCWERAWTKT